MHAPESLSIGALAKAADVNVETIRYYQRRGLLNVPRSVAGTIRRYGEDSLNRLAFIRRAQSLGFTLSEIERLLTLDGSRDRQRARESAQTKIKDIDARIADMKAVRQALTKLVSECANDHQHRSCPIIDAFRAPAARARSKARIDRN